jgi:HD-GYP domain-containing protein (c-di-GMP phosphodiesterase class II)
MNSEVTQLEPRLKEILYRCLEDIRATKAALYIAENGAFRLITQYGFSENPRRQLGANDVILDRLAMRRAAFFVNGLNSEPRFSELLFASQTDRILVAPMHVRGKLIGFLDLRDKAGKQPFAQIDLDDAKKIADQVVELLSQRGLVGAEPAGATATAEGLVDAGSSVNKILEVARVAVARDVARYRPTTVGISEGDLTAIRDVLPAILALPGATVAAFSAAGLASNVLLLAARSTLSDAAMSHLMSKLTAWTRSRGIELDPGIRTQMIYPFGAGTTTLTAAHLGIILSAPLQAGGMKGLALTVAFETAPDPLVRKNLEQFLQVIQQAVEHGGVVKTLRATRQKAAEKLLEPDFQKYPDLAEHSKKVSDLSDQFAHLLGLSGSEAETIRIAALVHDVGMRLLDYARLYRKQNISADELKLLREHPVVGAAIVEPVFGAEMANIVLSHHERADGRGYPTGIAGEAIPIGARVIQIVDAFDAMTSPHSYQTPMTEEAAIQQVLRMGGAEFDHSLATKFRDLIAR